MKNQNSFTVDPEIKAALAANRAVVALESTVIAHGLPRPQNLETAQRVEQIVSEQGATLWIAHRAGIRVFATGGIGGVHRGSLPDISADLPELSRTPMIVVCSGAKIVLDLPATREWLETYGITVVGYGCDEMPAFYSRRSALPVDVRCDSPAEVMQLFRAQRELGIESALLVAVPVPVEAEVPQEILNKILDDSLRDAENSNIGGRDLTPFLLARMAHWSEGATLRANIALLENNARVAAQIASELS